MADPSRAPSCKNDKNFPIARTRMTTMTKMTKMTKRKAREKNTAKRRKRSTENCQQSDIHSLLWQRETEVYSDWPRESKTKFDVEFKHVLLCGLQTYCSKFPNQKPFPDVHC